MIRRNFLHQLPSLAAIGFLNPTPTPSISTPVPANSDREYHVTLLTRIARPVLTELSKGNLKKSMPVESSGTIESRRKVTHLEALGRTLAGLAPWLELGPEQTSEGILRKEFIDLAVASVRNGVDPSSPDYLNFTEANQPLVDAAFLGHALLRAPTQLWENLDTGTQSRLISALRSTRVIKPYPSNWLLFSAMIEATLFKFSREQYDPTPVLHAMNQHEQWYKGDGCYGDGPEFHFDYYNSFVIHPMILDIAEVIER
jgi:hypothetical protein